LEAKVVISSRYVQKEIENKICPRDIHKHFNGKTVFGFFRTVRLFDQALERREYFLVVIKCDNKEIKNVWNFIRFFN
jgi:hypothetical protein